MNSDFELGGNENHSLSYLLDSAESKPDIRMPNISPNTQIQIYVRDVGDSECIRKAFIESYQRILNGYEKTGNAVFARHDDGPRYRLLYSGAAQDMTARYHIPK